MSRLVWFFPPEHQLLPIYRDISVCNAACPSKTSECATRPASKSWGWMGGTEIYAFALCFPIFLLINLHRESPWQIAYL